MVAVYKNKMLHFHIQSASSNRKQQGKDELQKENKASLVQGFTTSKKPVFALQ